MSQRDACKVDGDGDLYGLGIRLGNYLQWFSIILAYHYCPDKVAENWIMLNIFGMGMLVTLLWVVTTFNDLEKPYSFDVYIALVFGWAGGMTAQAANSLRSSATSQPVVISIYLWMLFNLGFSALSVWFWFSGLSSLKKPPCRASAFFFSEVSLLGWFAVFCKVMSVLGLFLTTLSATYHIWHAVVQFKHKTAANWVKWLFTSEDYSFVFSHANTAPTDVNRSIFLSMLIFQLAGFVFYVLMVELTLRWNHVDNVNTLKSTGQVIPFVTGLAVILRVVKSMSIIEAPTLEQYSL